MSWSSRLLLVPLLLAAVPTPGAAQTARISEQVRTLQTYPFSEPNPIPILTRDSRLYPYHSFEGYSETAEPREWNVVRLENDYIEVFVLPEVGGKVWGAIVKKTGHEFIYRNEVMKFRNIALRGPWTSGGIEFNFGVIGHTPSTATPVDYVLRENTDGSVSCWVGSMDLPSRTHWRVEIRLPADRAYFETSVLWYNPTPLAQPYYNWMTAAAFARNDLEVSMPGDTYLRHSGNEMTWPEDGSGRYLPLYRNNTFGGHKSYHVVGELHDFFGGYYHDEDYGFGHWSRHEEMPGQKLWLWALSRQGGVWEELLTDTDGQYVEFQAGRQFVQYSHGSAVNPITQVAFDPLSASRWTETWFPVEGTGGLTEASRDGAMYVQADGARLTVSVNSFGDISDTLKVWSGGDPADAADRGSARAVTVIPLTLDALEPYRTTVEITPGAPYRVELPALDLEYSSDPSGRLLFRPFGTDPEAWASIPEADRLVFEAREFLKGRRYRQARELFESALDDEPWNRAALLGMADLSTRSASYETGLEYANRALQLDAYDAEANFLAGVLYRALHRTADARDAFGWAARAMAYRSAAYVQLSEMMIESRDWAEAGRYARLALDYDRTSVPAWRALAVIGRRSADGALAEEAIRGLLTLDPLHHFARAEGYLSAGGAEAGAAAVFLNTLGGEFPDQSLLELAIGYANLGLPEDALALLALRMEAAPDPVHVAWQAGLAADPGLLAGSHDPAFAFPYRPESLPVLEWAAQNSGDWVWTYLLALNLWALNRNEAAAAHLESLGDEPDFGPMYVARAHLLSQVRGTDREPDLRRAVELAPEDRMVHIQLVRHLQSAGEWDHALAASNTAKQRFPDDFNLDLLQARALIHLGRAQDAARILAETRVLPSEGARDSHSLWEQAHLLAALDAMEAGDYRSAEQHLSAALEWPESLGQGRPYEPEERLARFLQGATEETLGNEQAAIEAFQAVVDATGELDRPLTRLDLLVVPALVALGRGAEAEELSRSREAELEALYEDLDTDLEGRMILRALQQSGRENG